MDEIPIISGLSHMYPDNPFFDSLRKTVSEVPDANWKDAFSLGQMQSKNWLVSELKKALDDRSFLYQWYPARTYICASWYSILAQMLIDQFGDHISRIRCFDIDPTAVYVGNRLMRHHSDGWRVVSSVKDIHELNFIRDSFTITKHDGTEVRREDTPDTIINTSCEHIQDFESWYSKIPEKKLLVLQSNDYFQHPEHVNCHDDIEEFEDATPMTEVYFSGVLELPKYKRFMRIGRR